MADEIQARSEYAGGGQCVVCACRDGPCAILEYYDLQCAVVVMVPCVKVLWPAVCRV